METLGERLIQGIDAYVPIKIIPHKAYSTLGIRYHDDLRSLAIKYGLGDALRSSSQRINRSQEVVGEIFQSVATNYIHTANFKNSESAERFLALLNRDSDAPFNAVRAIHID